jgi:RNA polymerase sigma-70 factor (ECF subfamily)
MSDQESRENVVEAAALRERSIPSDADRLESIFRDHHVQVFRAAYRITGSATDAEDVLQTVFLRLLRNDRGEILSDTPGSYLHRAAVNAALDVVRNRKTWKAAPLEEAEKLPEERSPDPERSRGDREIELRVRAALAGLNPRMAEVFALRYFEGYDNHEIARMLRTSKSTIAVLLHRARGRLKKEVRTFLGESR